MFSLEWLVNNGNGIPGRINAKKSINLTLDFMHICSPGLSEPEGDPGRAMPFPPGFGNSARGRED